MQDQRIKALSNRGGIRIIATKVSSIARQICLLQRTSATASIALGRAIAAGALMGGLLKETQRVALKFEGNGPIKKIIIEADYDGSICGTVGNPNAEAEPVNDKWNVPEIIGKAGFLTVSKDIGIGGEPYKGTVQLCTSEIGDDLAYYLTDSEQTPSAVGVGANLDHEGVVSICGGFLVQILPGADEEELNKITNTIKSLPPITTILETEGELNLIGRIFDDTPYSILEKRELNFKCSCSHSKVLQALRTFSTTDLNSMIKEEKGATVTCEFCRQEHFVSTAELHSIVNGEDIKDPTNG